MGKQRLFEPFNLKGLELKNSVVMAPMTRSRSNNADHAATELNATYYEQRATAGLIITEGTVVSPKATGYINVPGIYSEAQIKGWRLSTDAVHKKGGAIFAQIWHTGRISHPDLLDGDLPLAPSAINPHAKVFGPKGLVDTVTPKEMSIEDIKRTIQDFKNAAANALKAGFDGVELHAANGYLFHQFFNQSSNQRTDEYGGSIENRARFLFELLEELKEVIDLKRVGIRLNPSLHNMQGMVIDEGSIPVHEYIIQKLNDYDIAYVHLLEPFTPVEDVPHAVTNVAAHFRPLYKGNLIINKGFTAETANKVLEDGLVDLVSFGVPFIANPDLVARMQQNLPLATPDTHTFYTPGAKGYIDYPAYEQLAANS